MFRTKLTLASLVAAAAVAPSALAAHDPWYAYATSPTQAEQPATFITDTLASGGKAPVQGYRFITDTLAPGGGPSVVSAPASNGFDWGDAGIGAGAMAGIALFLGSATRLLHHRNDHRRSAVAV